MIIGWPGVQADFSGGHISSDGGVLLLRQIDCGLGIARALAQCFRDERDPCLIDHHKISHDPEKIEQALLKLSARRLSKHAEEIILDLDAMGHLLHGMQEVFAVCLKRLKAMARPTG